MKIPKSQLENFKLYKYFRFNDYFKSSLLNKQLWFSDYKQFNDPFELHSKYSMNEKELEEETASFIEMVSSFEGFKDNFEALEGLRLMIAEHPELLHMFLDLSFKSISKEIGICCFSTIPNDTLMWSHYSESHTGVVVEFDFITLYKSLLKHNAEYIYDFGFINYVKTFPIQKIGKIEKKYIRNELTKKLWTKLSKWQYENEFRIVSSVLGNQKFDVTSITAIIKGYRMSNEDSKNLHSILKTIELENNIDLKRISLNNDTGNLEIFNCS